MAIVHDTLEVFNQLQSMSRVTMKYILQPSYSHKIHLHALQLEGKEELTKTLLFRKKWHWNGSLTQILLELEISWP